MTHALHADMTSSGHARLTCNECNASLVRQPFMSDVLWNEARNAFIAAHPMPPPVIDMFTDVPGNWLAHGKKR